MKKMLCTIAVLLAPVSCQWGKEKEPLSSQAGNSLVSKTERLNPHTDNQEFLDKFRTVSVDTLPFVAPRQDERKIGPELTEKELTLFPSALELAYWGENSDIQAFLKFKMDDNHYGLITRMPGEYSFTSMKFFFMIWQRSEFCRLFMKLLTKLEMPGIICKRKAGFLRTGIS